MSHNYLDSTFAFRSLDKYYAFFSHLFPNVISLFGYTMPGKTMCTTCGVTSAVFLPQWLYVLAIPDHRIDGGFAVRAWLAAESLPQLLPLQSDGQLAAANFQLLGDAP